MILFPPHPNIKIPEIKLDEYEKSNKWVAQRKFNGTNILINISPERNFKLLTRHGSAPKLFSLNKSIKEQLLSLNLEKGKEYWFNGELLDHKTKSDYYKKRIILFDILHAGKYLINSLNQIQRLNLLNEICNTPSELESKGLALKVTENIWMAENWECNFKHHYQEFINLDEIEGLILRKKDSVIDNFGQKKYDASWIVKCRKPHSGGNYSF